jgi:spore coat protein U-like protein
MSEMVNVLHGLLIVVATLWLPLPDPQAPSCTISSTGVNFGNYDVFNASPNDTTGTISYQCNKKSDVTIHLNKGMNASTFDPRKMTGAGDLLNYNLYRTAARTSAVIWGDGTGGTVFYSLSNVAKDTLITVTIYGRVPAAQDVAAGAYSDSVTATINF